MGPWVVAQIYKGSKLAFSGINSNQRLGLSPFAGVATGLLKTPRTQLEKTGRIDTVPIPILNTFKVKIFHILSTDVTWLTTDFTAALDTGMQRQDKAYVVTSRLSVKMQIVLSIEN